MARFGRVLVAGCLLAGCTRAAAQSPEPAAPSVRAAPSGEAPAAPRAPSDAGTVLAPTDPSNAADTPEARVARYRALWKSPRHRPAALDQPPRASRLPPGAYLCKVSREYRLRDCSVERDAEGRTILEFSSGNLLAMRGVVSDAPNGIDFEGWLVDEQPFGCSSCQERCIAHPGTCACDPLPPDAVVECLKQPLHVSLRALGAGQYRGVLRYRVYYNQYVGEGANRRPEGYEAKEEALEVELVKKTHTRGPARE